MDPQPMENPTLPKAWHASVCRDSRNHLVGKFVNAVYPSNNPADIQKQGVKDLISYARKVESKMFLLAESKEEHYHLLAEKIYKIQQDIKEKNRIREQHRQQEAVNELLKSLDQAKI